MKVKDPVCGMEIESEKAAGRIEHDGTMYYFCSSGCRKRFSENPGQYAKAGAEEHHSARHQG